MNIKRKINLKIIYSLATFVFMWLLIGMSNSSLAAQNTEKMYEYLSDISYVESQSKTAYSTIKKDTTCDNTSLSLKINGTAVTFKKGVFAHATSTVVYDLTNYSEYDYFTTYYGVSAHKGTNGSVKFSIYTSADGQNWNLQTEQNPEIMTAASEAKFVKIPLEGVKFIKLYADSNGANGQDHSLYADAKLTKEGYSDNVTKTVEEYDELIKAKYETNNKVIDDELELLLLQRNLVKKVGQYTLKNFVEESKENRDTFDWFFNNQEALRLWTVGGKPDGTYERALDVLSKVYNTYKNDLNDETEFTNKFATVKAKDLYLKMMLALSLTHSTNVYLWVDASSRSDAVVRYDIYKQMHLKGKLNNDIFENLTVEEMRWVVNNIIDDEEIEWLNDLMKKRNLNDGHGAYQFITYRNGYNYNKDQYYSEENYAKWDEKYDLTSHNITYQKGHPRLWIVFEEGSVCGGLAKTWSNMRGSRGIPSSVVGQPGHAAAITYSKDNEGRGMWSLVNDVSGWSNSGRTERIGIRMPNEWGEYNIATYGATLKPDSYVLLAQQAQNEYEKYEASEIVLLLEDVYRDDHEKLDRVYKKALEEEEINFDALYGLVMLYKNDETFTEEQCYELAERIAQTYTYHPLPMYDLLRTIASRIVSPNYQARLATLQDKHLRLASAGNTADANAHGVIQPSIAKTVANTILGLTDNTVAKFSFDGEDAEKLMLSSRFDASGEVRWDYSLDGGTTWTATSEKSVKLTKQEIESITVENDIKIHIVGVSYTPENIFTIDIKKANNPSGLYLNDLENRIIGATNVMEWKVDGTEEWTSYKDGNAVFEGDKVVKVRVGATGLYLPSDSVTMTFTDDNQPNTRKYIPISNLSISRVSSEATANSGHAVHAIDGNINTVWHSNYQGQDSQRYIVIKLAEPKYISALEYIPRQSGTNGRVNQYVMSLSMDGENFEEVAKGNWANNAATKVIDLPDSVMAQYIKLQALSNYGDGRNFITAIMINLFEDLTGDRPRASIEYSNLNATAEPVTAKLIPEGDNIRITNNNGSNTYTFVDNDTFTFEFENTKTHKTGTATATVYWMRKCSFSFDGDKANKIIISSKYKPEEGSSKTLRWQYSLDGTNWVDVTSETEKELTEDELALIHSANGIQVRVNITESAVGEDSYTIAIEAATPLPNNLYANDLENRLIGATNNMEWRIEGNTGTWTSFDETIPTLFTGDKEIEVRIKATGTTAASASQTFNFTEDTNTATKTYIPISNLSIESYSSQSIRPARNEYEPAIQAIDGNINTIWHTDHTLGCNSDGTSIDQRFIVIKLAKPKFISHIQYVAKPNYNYGIMQAGIIQISVDGQNWETVKVIDNNDTDTVKTTNALADKRVQEISIETSFYAKYVRLQCTKSYDYVFGTDKSTGKPMNYFLNAAMINLFEDTTKTAVAKEAKIEYSTTTETIGNVTATISSVDGSDITIINNNGLNTYTFITNGKFTFEYEDENGFWGSKTAEVSWIDYAPTGEVSYETANNKVTATIKFSEPVNILNTNITLTKLNDTTYRYVFVENANINIEYEDLNGNKGENIKLLVNWIVKKAPVATVEYSTTSKTNQDVIATVVCDEPITITSNNGQSQYVFTENGTIEFIYMTEDYSEGKVIATVNWIDKEAPVGTITYDITETTDQNVTATISFDKENVTITNNDGNNTYTFTKNGEFTFEFVDEVGNTGTATAKVDWIEEKQQEDDEPRITSEEYDVNDNIISNISQNTTVNDFTENTETIGNAKILDRERNEVVNDTKLQTGYIVQVELNNKSIEYEIAVKGDIHPNGEVNLKDLVKLNQVLLGKTSSLQGVYNKAADLNNDSKISIKDLVKLNQILLGKSKL